VIYFATVLDGDAAVKFWRDALRVSVACEVAATESLACVTLNLIGFEDHGPSHIL
jgi:hypothetical protein